MLFLCRISVVRWFLFIFISNHPRATKRKIYAHPHLFWAIWICHGNSRRIAGSVWKSYLQTVSTRYLIAFWWHHIIIEGFFFFCCAYSSTEYPKLPNEAVIINTIGILMVAFSGIVVYLATNKHFRRVPLPEDAILLTGRND